MPRKSKHVVIPPAIEGARENRDAGKTFLITEQPSAWAEKWAARAFLAVSHAGVEVPPGVLQLGIVGAAMIGMRAFANTRWEDVEPLMDDMMRCVRICPNPNDREVVRDLIPDDIEEVETRMKLRQEAIELHAGFTFADAAWMLQQRASASVASQTTSTSPG